MNKIHEAQMLESMNKVQESSTDIQTALVIIGIAVFMVCMVVVVRAIKES